jgi:hypothetical protein
MDRQISYASNAGLSYWAFCYYPTGTGGLDTARNLYLSSTQKADINWCAILGVSNFSSVTDLPFLINQFKTANYQKVLNGRPLIYFFSANDNTASTIIRIRSGCVESSIPDPYIVIMNFSASAAAQSHDTVGGDAISSYAGIYGSSGASYASGIAQGEKNAWDTYKNTNKKVIPWVTTGWDPRPRILYNPAPYPYGTYSATNYIAPGSAVEIANHLQDAITWSGNNADTNEANAIVMYSWNEFDEGGITLCPTLYDGSKILDKVKEILTHESNLSYGKTVTSSTSTGAGNSALMSNDNNLRSYWAASSGTMPQWLKVDLGGMYNINHIYQRFHNDDSFTYKLEGSNDDSIWTVLADRTLSGTNNQYFDETVSGRYRYIKFTVTGSTNGNWASSDDFVVYGAILS